MKNALNVDQFSTHQEGVMPPVTSGVLASPAARSSASQTLPGNGNPPDTDFELIARAMEGLLAQMAAMVPDLFNAQREDSSSNTARGVSAAFVNEAVVTVGATPLLEQVVDLSGVPHDLRYVQAFSVVVSMIRKFEQDLVYSINLKKTRNGSAALKVYKLAQALAVGAPPDSPLTKYVAAMKKSLGRSGRKKKVGGSKTAPLMNPPSTLPPAVPEPAPAPNVFISTIPPERVR